MEPKAPLIGGGEAPTERSEFFTFACARRPVIDMSAALMSKRFTQAALAPSLRPALPRLAAGTLAALLSGLAMLAALWCVVQFVADLTIGWVITALGL